MRIIGGALGGRNFASPRGRRTHPMGDKVRGALFNTLGDINGLTVLDAFAGSGALAFEAVSRGASRVVAIDSDRAAQQVIADNISALGLQDKVQLIRASVSGWLNTSDDTFDLVFCDPPYDDLRPSVLEKVAVRLKQGGILVFSLPPQPDISVGSRFALEAKKSYGDAELYFYRRIS